MKFVICGTVGAGKTTVTRLLEQKKYFTYGESNRRGIFETRDLPRLDLDFAKQRKIRDSFLGRDDSVEDDVLYERSLRDFHLFNKALVLKYPDRKDEIDQFAREERDSYNYDETNTVYFYLRTTPEKSKNNLYERGTGEYWDDDTLKGLCRLHDEEYYGKPNVVTLDAATETAGTLADEISIRIRRIIRAEEACSDSLH